MRTCLLEPVPELHAAADLLDAAATALLTGNRERAAELARAADFPEIGVWIGRICRYFSPEVHRNMRRPKTLPKSERVEQRMPGAAAERQVFRGDGWRCRFCGIRVISRDARRVLIRALPEAIRWPYPGQEFQRHTALFAMASSLDHVVPHSRGGTNSRENFVTCCHCCQVGRGEWLLEEVELLDPRGRPPVVGGWDGLERLRGWSPSTQTGSA